METPETEESTAKVSTETSPTPGAEPEPAVQADPARFEPAGGTETDEALEARLAEQREAQLKLQAEIPTQQVKIRPDSKSGLLGLVVRDSITGHVLRVARMADWKTEVIELKACQAAHVIVLAGEDLELFERMEQALAELPAAAPAAPSSEA